MKQGIIIIQCLCCIVICNAQRNISTVDMAKKVLEKGLKETQLSTYQGSLLLQGMAELAIAGMDKELLDRTVDTLAKFGTKAIDGRGSFISYQAGGSAAALLNYRPNTTRLNKQVAGAANQMLQKQKRSGEGLLVPGWVSDSLDQVFIDMAFAVTPYLLYAGLKENNNQYIDLAIFETLELFKILNDPKTGLLHQGRGFRGKNIVSEDNWSRGNGWGALAIATLVRDLPDNHPKRKEVERVAKDFFLAVLRYQDKAGLWHQEMTAPASFTETSGSGLMLYGLGILLEKSLLEKKYSDYFLKGIGGLTAYIAADGGVSHACFSCLCPRKGTKADYINHVWVYNDPHAFGPVVLALAQAVKMGHTSILTNQKPGALALIDTITPVIKTYVRYVPERSQDIAWENDRIAFRYYGPPVRDKVSSGIDIWAKSVEHAVIDKWYRLNARGLDYHADRGEGCDFYHMGFLRGCGGTAIVKNNKPYVSTTYASHRIIKNDPHSIEFELNFDEWEVDGANVSEQKIISMVNGTNFFRVTSTLQTTGNPDMIVGIGLTTFGKPLLVRDKAKGLLSSWEAIDPNHGSLGTAVYVDPKKFNAFVKFGNDEYILVKVKANQPFTYYVGAGWDGNKMFAPPGAWQKMLADKLSWNSLNAFYTIKK
ncbi:MAG: DUF4861 family protein [Ferruginibacter sp.]|nr:DUF4861 family protein [Ferruginibacter sp.]